MRRTPPTAAFLRRMAVLAAVSTLSAGTAVAGSPQQANRAAYAHTVTCFVANMTAAGMRKDKGDMAKAAVYEANAERSFNGAMKIGSGLGLSSSQVNRDFDAALAREMPRMMQDADYFVGVVATCRGLGLM